MIKLGTKAETLNRLYGKLLDAKVLEQVAFTVKQWDNNARDLWKQAEERLGKGELIVRSSALNEDTATSSQAGKFESVGNVSGYESFCKAVNTVIASFEGGDDNDQILVQPMLQNVKYCGVAFTMDPSTLGNYYVINYDETGSTSAITSGSGKEDKLLYVFKGGKTRKGCAESYIEKLCQTLGELENLFGQNNLDVEFAVTGQGELYIFQVRALCLNGASINCDAQRREISRIEQKIKCEQSPKPFLRGTKAIYGVMPDWNPAEMIGIRPKPLAMSLYREVITDSTWAYQRDNYGYRNLRSFPLMVDFCGMPYIDVRVSFNSFVPAELDERVSEKLVNYYIERLAEDPSKHDKVEFEIVFSCYTLDLPRRIHVLREHMISRP